MATNADKEVDPKEDHATPPKAPPASAAAAPAPAPTKGEGVKKAEAELAAGADPAKLGKLLYQYPGEKDAILALIQSHPAGGNTLTTKVVEESQKLHWDGKKKSIVAGDPDSKTADYFIAGAEPKGVKWRSGANDGKIDGDGLDTRQHLGEGDIHGTANYKGGKAVAGVGYEANDKSGSVTADVAVDPKTKGVDVGLKGEKELRPGERAGIELRGGASGASLTTTQSSEHDGNKASGSQSVGVDKDGNPVATWGVSATSKEGLSVDAKHSEGPGGSKDHFGLGVKGSGGSAGGSLDLLNGELAAAELHGTKKLDDKTSVTGNLSYAHTPEKDTVGGGLTLNGDGFSVGGKGSASDDGDYSLSMRAAKKLGEKGEVSLEGGTEKKDGKTSEFGALSAVYSAERFHIGGDLKLRHTLDGTEVSGSGEGIYALKPGLLYGHVFGEAKLGADGKAGAALGAGLTLTPHDHVALTLAGVIDPTTNGFDARLSVDIFAKKIDTASLSATKRKAAVSLFMGIKGGTMMDNQFGAGGQGNLNLTQPMGGGGATGYAGVKWSF